MCPMGQRGDMAETARAAEHASSCAALRCPTVAARVRTKRTLTLSETHGRRTNVVIGWNRDMEWGAAPDAAWGRGKGLCSPGDVFVRCWIGMRVFFLRG